MRYNYIHGTVEEREAWIFKLFDDFTNSQDSWIKRKGLEFVYRDLKDHMSGSYLNNNYHKLHKYIRDIIHHKLIQPELLDYVLVSCIPRNYFEKLFGTVVGGAVTLGVAFPWLYPGTEKISGAEAVSMIFIWDVEGWIESRNKWYYKMFFGDPNFVELDPEICMKGIIYHELVHARQQIFDQKRLPPRQKDGTINYKNYLEVEAYSLQFEYCDKLMGETYYLDKYNAKTYKQAAKNYLDRLLENNKVY